MKILCTADDLADPYGLNMSTLQLCRSFAERGDHITLLRRQGGEIEAAFREFTDDIIPVRSFHLRVASPVSDALRLPDAVRAAWRAQPDVIYLQRAEQLVWGALSTFGGNIRPRPGAHRRRTPFVVHLRHHPSGTALRTLARRVTTFIAVSDFIRDEWIAAGLPPDKVVTVHNGIDPDEYPLGDAAAGMASREALGLPAGVALALYYGRLDPEKGLDHLVRAWRLVRRDRPDAVLVVVGDSVTHRDPESVQRLLDDEPGVLSRPSTRDVVSYLHACDAVVLPATWDEPFGRVVIEGLSAGRPVVAAATGGIPEILTGDLAALTYPRSDDGALADRLRTVLGSRDDNGARAASLRDHVVRRFSLRQTVDSVHEVLLGAAQLGPEVPGNRRRP